VLEGDLVDSCKPGDRVMLTGVYKPLTGRSAAAASGHFRSVVIVNSVEKISQAEQASMEISADDLREMKGLAEKHNVLNILGRSLAPSIYGHDWIKKVLPSACIFGVRPLPVVLWCHLQDQRLPTQRMAHDFFNACSMIVP
jgi:DNA replication licensing factor MCM3